MVDSLHRALAILARPAELRPAAFEGLFGGGGASDPPKPPPVAQMPDLYDPAILERKRQAMDATLRTGRSSTNLSGNQGDYSGDKLGTP